MISLRPMRNPYAPLQFKILSETHPSRLQFEMTTADQLIIFQPVSQKKQIAVVPGDGIGPEVIAQAVNVIQASGADVELTQFDWSANRYLADGVTVPPDGFAMLERDFDAILLGAFGDPRVPRISMPRKSCWVCASGWTCTPTCARFACWMRRCVR